MRKIILFLFIFLISLISSYSLDNYQITSKILMNPFYRVSMFQNTNYTYDFSINPPDKISNVLTALINLQIYITPTVTISAWVNGTPCDTPSYTVSTTYASAGQSLMTFDCTNVVNKQGYYRLTLRPTSANTGASTVWIDVTYNNNQSDYVGTVGVVDRVDNVSSVDNVKGVVTSKSSSLTIHGTEYVEGDDGTIFLLLKDANGIPIVNASCTLDIYYPNIAGELHPKWVNNGVMLYKEEGLYFYDFTVPLTTGLYMVNAQCVYLTSENYFYTLSKGFGPIRNVTYGTYTGDSFVLNDYQEWLYVQCDSGIAGSGQKACDASNEWNISSTTSGNVTGLSVLFLGENNGFGIMTQYWWNWTGNSWVTLPNTLTFKATASTGVPSGVDEYLSNTVPLSAIGTGTNNGLVRIRSNTVAGSTFKQFNNWLILKTIQYSSSIQDLKGSGEIHVSSSESGVNRFFKILSCDGYADMRCGVFTDDGEYDLEEGEIEDFLNISASSTKSAVINYETPFSVDCTALYWIKEYNGTDWVDFTDYTVYSQTSQENCVISLNKDIISGTEYQFWFKMDSYMTWEVEYTRQIENAIKPYIETFCADRNVTYDTPINENTVMPDDIISEYCYRSYDDFYWIDNYYNLSLDVGVAGEYSSYLQEMRFYRKELYNRYQFLNLNKDSSYNFAYTIWDNPSRNLTYYPSQVNLSNYTQMIQDMWLNQNRTLSEMGVLWIGGSEYDINETTGKIIVRMVNSNGVPVVGGICSATIMYPNMSAYSNYSLTEITIRSGMYYSDFIIPKTLGIYPYGVDCTQGGKNYYLADSFHVRDMNKEVWYYPQNRSLTDNGNLLISESVWHWEGSIVDNILDKISQFIWNALGAKAEILT